MRIERLRGTLVGVAALLTLAVGALAIGADAASTPPDARAQKFTIGKYSAIALEDGTISEPNDNKSFVVGRPPAEVAEVLKSGGAPGDHFEFNIHPLLVHAGNRVLLFDTGAGSDFGPIAGKLGQSMAAAGVDPSSVTDIFISHAHGDHVGGLVTATGALAFPGASIHMSAPEWQWLSGMNAEEAKNVGLAHVTTLVAAIRPKVVAFQPGAILIPGIVKAVEIKGHTPGHSGYMIGSGKDSLFYIGDAMHSYVVSVRKPSWKIAFDHDQETGAASRVALEERVAASGQRLYAVHFPFPGIGKIAREKDGYVWVPESFR